MHKWNSLTPKNFWDKLIQSMLSFLLVRPSGWNLYRQSVSTDYTYLIICYFHHSSNRRRCHGLEVNLCQRQQFENGPAWAKITLERKPCGGMHSDIRGLLLCVRRKCMFPLGRHTVKLHPRAPCVYIGKRNKEKLATQTIHWYQHKVFSERTKYIWATLQASLVMASMIVHILPPLVSKMWRQSCLTSLFPITKAMGDHL